MSIQNQKIVLAAVFASAVLAVSPLKAAAPNLPSWEQVQKIVDQQLNSVGDYQSGDLISKRQVDPIFDLLQRAGWTVRDRAEIMNFVCADNDAIIRQFRRSSAGKQFMRQVNKAPYGYDRVDQIDRLQGGRTLGESTIEMLISTPGGYKNIWNLDKSSAQQIQMWMLAPGWNKIDFNGSTGRLYTAEAFLARLKKSYEAALAGN
jgi:hypothetical protein